MRNSKPGEWVGYRDLAIQAARLLGRAIELMDDKDLRVDPYLDELQAWLAHWREIMGEIPDDTV